MEPKTPSQTARASKFGSEESETAHSDVATATLSDEDFGAAPDLKSTGLGSESINQDILSLKDDLASLKASIASLTANAATSTMGLANDTVSKVADTVSGAASAIAEKSSNAASAATKGAQSLGVEVEDLTRRNPLAALAGAVVLGLLLGMASRGRS